MLSSFFKPVPSWDMDRAKKYIADHKLDQFNLIDVRQPAEYAEGHIPGATLIPLGELANRLDEIDRGKPTLVYCRSGGRAGNATALLSRSGFGQAYNIGGIAQWNGLVASGAPEAGMAVFEDATTPQQHVALAWAMEEGARLFYQELGTIFTDHRDMFEAMAMGEAQHRDQLARLHGELTGQAGDPSLPNAEELMEGGIDRAKALAWARQRELIDVLDFAAAMEANAHDRYILVGRAVGGATEQAFIELAEAEKVHLEQLMRAFNEQRG